MYLEGDDIASNIVMSISSLWKGNDLPMLYTILSDVLAKIRRNIQFDWSELNLSIASSFSVVGSYASYKPKLHRIFFSVPKIS